MILVHRRWPFPTSFHTAVRSVLQDEVDLAWNLQTGMKRAARGMTYQLNTNAKWDSVRFFFLTQSFVSRASEILVRDAPLGVGVPIATWVPQVFPVRMCGSVTDPPHQLPHQDKHAFEPEKLILPEYTFVYYVAVDGCSGGDLILFDSLGKQEERIHPTTGDLVCIAGDQWHAVSNLVTGERLSLVLNLYLPSTGRSAGRVWPGGGMTA